MHKAVLAYGKLPPFTRIKGSKVSHLEKALGITVDKFYGTKGYAKGQKNEGTALNASRRDALKETLKQLPSNPELTGEQSKQVRKILEKEIN